MKKLRIIALALLLSSVIVTADLLVNFLAATIPSMNDGIASTSMFQTLFEDNWSVEFFFDLFVTSLWVSVAIAACNVGLSAFSILRDDNE